MSTFKVVPRLPINSCEALFEKLKWDHQQLENDWTSSYTAFNFVVTAYHLYQDWIRRAGTDEQKLRLQELPLKGKLLFNVWRDITNAVKHWELNERSRERQVIIDITGPVIGDWGAYLFHGPVLYVRVGEALPSLPELTSATISCFTWILEGEESTQLSLLNSILDIIFRPLTKNEQQELINDVNGA